MSRVAARRAAPAPVPAKRAPTASWRDEAPLPRGGFLERCRRLRQALDPPAFTTDVIVGFPGETDADFEATCRVVREVGFSRIHVFSYSPPARHAGGGLPRSGAARRDRRSAASGCARSSASWPPPISRSLVGRRLEVLVEGDPRTPGSCHGHELPVCAGRVPGSRPALFRRLVPVRTERVDGGVLWGRPEPGSEFAAATTGGRRVALPQVTA